MDINGTFQKLLRAMSLEVKWLMHIDHYDIFKIPFRIIIHKYQISDIMRGIKHYFFHRENTTYFGVQPDPGINGSGSMKFWASIT